MMDPISIAAVTIVVKTASAWFPPIRDALLNKAMDKGAENAIGKSMKDVHALLHLDEKEQVRHLKLALKNAVERGLAKFHTPEEQQQYLSILNLLSESNSHSETLRREAMQLFTLSDTPNIAELNKIYNQSLLSSSQMQTAKPHAFVDTVPYLSSFFDALITELYDDPFFRPQMSDVLQVRATMSMKRTFTEVVETLRQISGALINDYTTEQFERDVEAYVTHTERTLRYLKLAGEVPKGRGSNENKDPELDGIFVPLRITMLDRYMFKGQTPDSIVSWLDNTSYLPRDAQRDNNKQGV
jgi:hypothetical protein